MKSLSKPVTVSLWMLSAATLLAVLGSGAAPLPAESKAPEMVAPAPEAPDCALLERPAPEPMASTNWTFEGCFSFTGTSPCLDAFRDSSGNLWVCQACGTTTNPNRGKCDPLPPFGFWCS